MEDEKALVPAQHEDILDISKHRMEEGLKKIKEFQQIVRKLTTKGQDYGTIPGTKKATLLKPGAEKIAKLLSLSDDYNIISKNENWDREEPFFSYTVKCSLQKIGTGELISTGVGECNSLESKYRWRWVFEREVPKTAIKDQLKTKRTKKGYILYRISNDDIFSQVNTLLKMAKKRALVDAALSAGRLSEIFTQDIEDLHGNGVELKEGEGEKPGEEKGKGENEHSSETDKIKQLLKEREVPDTIRKQIMDQLPKLTKNQAKGWIKNLEKRPKKKGTPLPTVDSTAEPEGEKQSGNGEKPPQEEDSQIRDVFIAKYIETWLKSKGVNPKTNDKSLIAVARNMGEKKVRKMTTEQVKVAIAEMEEEQ